MQTTASVRWLSGFTSAVGNCRRTLLHRAVDNHDLDIVREVLQLPGISINVGDHLGRTALYMACKAGDTAIVELLLHNGASSKCTDRGDTPLMAAARKGSTEMVQLLLSSGCNVNASSGLGKTALWLACFYGAGAVVQLLLAAGADVNAADQDGATPLMAARHSGCMQSTQQLLAVPAIAINAKCCKGYTALMIAVRVRAPAPMIELLLQAGADVNLCDKQNVTPLMAACIRGLVYAAQQLLAVPGIEVNAKDVSGHTALMYACSHRTPTASIIQQLLRAGADVRARGLDDQSALDMACKAGDAAVIKLLLAAGAPLPASLDETSRQHLQAVIHDLAQAEAVPRSLQEAAISLAHGVKRRRTQQECHATVAAVAQQQLASHQQQGTTDDK